MYTNNFSGKTKTVHCNGCYICKYVSDQALNYVVHEQRSEYLKLSSDTNDNFLLLSVDCSFYPIACTRRGNFEACKIAINKTLLLSL